MKDSCGANQVNVGQDRYKLVFTNTNTGAAPLSRETQLVENVYLREGRITRLFGGLCYFCGILINYFSTSYDLVLL